MSHSTVEQRRWYPVQSNRYSAQHSVHNTHHRAHRTQFLWQVLRGVVLVHPNVLSDSLNSFSGLLLLKPVRFVTGLSASIQILLLKQRTGEPNICFRTRSVGRTGAWGQKCSATVAPSALQVSTLSLRLWALSFKPWVWRLEFRALRETHDSPKEKLFWGIPSLKGKNIRNSFP